MSQSNGSFLKADGVRVYTCNAEKKTSRAVLLIHEWWGLNPQIQALADTYALWGYNAVAVDLYDGKLTSDRATAQKYMEADYPEASLAKLEKVLKWMRSPQGGEANRIATVGWCFGGGYSLQCALRYGELIQGAVIYYGKLETDPKKLKDCRVPLLGIFAKRDTWIDFKQVDAFKRACNEAGAALESHEFDAEHAFANPMNPWFDAELTSQAADKVVAFLREVLG